MPAVASIEDLKSAESDLKVWKERYPEAAIEFESVLKVNAKVGYKNIAKLIFGKTAEELKG